MIEKIEENVVLHNKFMYKYVGFLDATCTFRWCFIDLNARS